MYPYICVKVFSICPGFFTPWLLPCGMKEREIIDTERTQTMATSRKSLPDRAAGEIMLTEVFSVVQRLNAAAGQSMVQKGARSGNMTFNPKMILAEDGSKH